MSTASRVESIFVAAVILILTIINVVDLSLIAAFKTANQKLADSVLLENKSFETRPTGIFSGASSSTQLSADTSGWKIYTDKAYGFGVRFPRDWQVKIVPSGIELNNSQGSEFAILQSRNEKILTLDDWFHESTVIGGRPTAKASAQSTRLNGRPAYKLDSGLEPPNPLFEVFVADDQRRIFALDATSANSTDTIILTIILSTFKFIPLEKI